MTLSYNTTLRNARLDAITTAVGNAGVIKIWSGSIPANVGASTGASVLLAQLTCGTPFAAAASGGVLTIGPIATESSADATGTATYFRVYTSGGTAIFQGSVSTSGADLNMNTTAIQAGAAISITSAQITDGTP